MESSVPEPMDRSVSCSSTDCDITMAPEIDGLLDQAKSSFNPNAFPTFDESKDSDVPAAKSMSDKTCADALFSVAGQETDELGKILTPRGSSGGRLKELKSSMDPNTGHNGNFKTAQEVEMYDCFAAADDSVVNGAIHTKREAIDTSVSPSNTHSFNSRTGPAIQCCMAPAYLYNQPRPHPENNGSVVPTTVMGGWVPLGHRAPPGPPQIMGPPARMGGWAPLRHRAPAGPPGGMRGWVPLGHRVPNGLPAGMASPENIIPPRPPGGVRSPGSMVPPEYIVLRRSMAPAGSTGTPQGVGTPGNMTPDRSTGTPEGVGIPGNMVPPEYIVLRRSMTPDGSTGTPEGVGTPGNMTPDGSTGTPEGVGTPGNMTPAGSTEMPEGVGTPDSMVPPQYIVLPRSMAPAWNITSAWSMTPVGNMAPAGSMAPSWSMTTVGTMAQESFPCITHEGLGTGHGSSLVPPISSHPVSDVQSATSLATPPQVPSRPGSSASLRNTAVPGIKSTVSEGTIKPTESSTTSPSKKSIVPKIDLSRIPVNDALAEIEVRMKRLHDATNFTASTDDLAYLRAVTQYRQHRSPERVLLIERMAELKVVEIFRKIFENHATKKLTSSLRDIMVVHWNGTDSSSVLCQSVLDSQLYKYIFQLLEDEYFSPEAIAKNVSRKYILKGLMGILNNTSRLLNSAQMLFRECKGIEILKKYRETEDDMVRCKTEIILSYLMTDKEYEDTDADDTSIKYIMTLLEDAMKSPDHQSKRYGFSVDEILDAINRIAVSDFNKQKIINHGALQYYSALLTVESSRDEQYLAARGIWTLAFKCKDEILKEEICFQALKKLESVTEDDGIRKQAIGALWILDEDKRQDLDDEPVSGDEIPHVFISYQWGHQETILRVRDHLQESGYKVWMDVESMSGSILEAMARAVEKAAVVVICMSETYKQSPNCRTEAEYTFRLQKEIVPLKMQQRYQPDGWLGALVGNKLFFDFSTDNRFEKSMAGLVRELGTRGQASVRRSNSHCTDQVEGKITATRATTTSAPPVTVPPSAATWSETRVQEWLSKMGLETSTRWFDDVDGAMIFEMRHLCQEAPEFYYKMLRDEVNMSLKSVLKFSRSLKQLK